MTSDNSPFEPRVDIFMPVYVGRFLQNTMHLGATGSGAYFLLSAHIWTRGPLPNDPARLAAIAKLTPAEWDMLGAELMQLLSIGPDGMLHDRVAEREKDKWVAKRLKAHEKAVKAAQARWSKHRAKVGGKVDAPSIAQELQEQCPLPLEEQLQKPSPPPTPAPGRGLDAPSIADASSMPGGPSIPAPVPRPGPTAVAGSASHRAPLRMAASVNKAKPPKNAPGATQNGSGRPRAHLASNGAMAVPVHSEQQIMQSAVAVADADPRREVFHEEVLAFWRDLNPGSPDYLFSRADERALDALLESSPGLSLDVLQASLRNRAQSEVTPGARPQKWLRSILEFAEQPLDRFGKPLRLVRQV